VTKLNAELLTVSVDSIESHKVWHEVSPSVQKATWPMVSDISRRMSRAYGVLNEETGVAMRGAFFIDPEGKIRLTMVFPPQIGRSTEDALRVLKALQHFDATGEVTPANWQPGEPAITPRLQDAGKA